MARILGWYKKRPGKQIRETAASCQTGWVTGQILGKQQKVVELQFRANDEHLVVMLTATEARGLAAQLLAAVEYMEHPPVEKKYPKEKP